MSDKTTVRKSSVNGKLYVTNENNEVVDTLKILDDKFLDRIDANTYIPKYNIESTRNKLENAQPTEPATDDKIKDYTREAQVEFPARTQIRNWIRQEFINRTRNFGLQYTENGEASTYTTDELDYMKVYDNFDTAEQISEYDDKLYKGPKSAWVRVCSNAIVADPNDENKVFKGFILSGNGNFHDTYGFDRGQGEGGGGEAVTLLGYDLDGKRHEINEPHYKHRPTPGVTSIETEDTDPGKNFRRTTINFTCWSNAQLDYLHAYFMQTGVSCCVEWGWNTFPRDALLPLNEQGMPKIGQIFTNTWSKNQNKQPGDLPPMSEHIKKGRGNVACTIGMIHSFNYTMRPDGGYDCTCTISCMSEIMTALNNKASELLKSKKDAADETPIVDGRVTDIRHFMTSTLGRLLINEADGQYDPNEATDVRMSDINAEGTSAKLDKMNERMKKFENTQTEYENSQKINVSVAEIKYSTNGTKGLKNIKVDTSGFIGALYKSSHSFRNKNWKVTAIEGYSVKDTQSASSDKIIRKKINVSKIPRNIKNLKELEEVWPYNAGKKDSDWRGTRLYVQQVTESGQEMGKMTPPKNLINAKKENRVALKISRGRWFTFNPYSATKHYYAGKQNAGGTYITVGYMIDIFNIFFGRTANDNQFKICEFSCWSSRAIAHPNIKSVNGDVLLIPNALAPRWNTKLGGFQQSTANAYEGDDSSASYRVLKQGESQSGTMLGDTTSSFLNMINSTVAKDSPGQTLDEALRKSPRDDLHRILADNAEPGMNLQHPAVNNSDESKLRPVASAKEAMSGGNRNSSAVKMNNNYSIDGAYENKENTIRPFPDYQYHDTMGTTDGYSGRIADLFVNMQVIKDAVLKNDNADKMILYVMDQISTAAGGIWNFDLIGGDTNTASNHILQLVDLNYSGAESVDDQKRKSWLFNAHTGNSIIRGISMDVSTTSEVSSQIIYGGGIDTKNNAFLRGSGDMLLQHCKPSLTEVQNQVKNYSDKEKIDPDLPSSEKFIVALKGRGMKDSVKSNYKSRNVDSELTKELQYSYYELDDKGNPTGEKQIKTASSKQERDKEIKKLYAKKNNTVGVASGNPYLNKAGTSAQNNTLGNQQQYIEIEVGVQFGVLEALWKKRTGKSRLNADASVDKVNKHSGKGDPQRIGAQLEGYEFKGDGIKVFQLRTQISEKRLQSESMYTIIDAYKDNYVQSFDGTEDNSRMVYVGGKENSNTIVTHRLVLLAPHTDATDGNNEWVPAYTQAEMRAEGIKVFNEGESQSSKEYADTRSSQLKESNREGPPLSTNDNIRGVQNMERQVATYKAINDGGTFAGESTEFYGTDKDDFEIDVELVDPDQNRMLNACRTDLSSPKNNIVFNQPIHGIELNLELDGIEGLRLYDVFSCTGVPVKYYNTGIFGITAIKHSVTGNDWKTDVSAQWYPDSSNI